MAPTFPLAAGLYGAGDGWTIEPAAWQWLFGGRYFARAIDASGGAADGEVLGAWTFHKTTHARVQPYRSSEIETELEVLAEPDPYAPPALDQVAAPLPAPSAPVAPAPPQLVQSPPGTYPAPAVEPSSELADWTDWMGAADEPAPGWDQGGLP